MPGTKGRSGGRNAIPIAEHLRHGTYRPHRHGQAVAAAPFEQPEPTPVEPPARLLRGLGDAGKTFIRDVFREHEVSRVEQHVIRLAAEALDDAATARAANEMKAVRAAGRQFLAAMQRLNLPKPE